MDAEYKIVRLIDRSPYLIGSIPSSIRDKESERGREREGESKEVKSNNLCSGCSCWI